MRIIIIYHKDMAQVLYDVQNTPTRVRVSTLGYSIFHIFTPQPERNRKGWPTGSSDSVLSPTLGRAVALERPGESQGLQPQGGISHNRRNPRFWGSPSAAGTEQRRRPKPVLQPSSGPSWGTACPFLGAGQLRASSARDARKKKENPEMSQIPGVGKSRFQMQKVINRGPPLAT